MNNSDIYVMLVHCCPSALARFGVPALKYNKKYKK